MVSILSSAVSEQVRKGGEKTQSSVVFGRRHMKYQASGALELQTLATGQHFRNRIVTKTQSNT